MASPRPWSSEAASPALACLRNRFGKRSGAIPGPSSETETATCTSSRTAATQIGDDPGACCAALAKKVVEHVDDAPPVGHHEGRPAGRSTTTAWRPPPLRCAERGR